MAKIVDLEAYRTRSIERRGFGPWKKRFDRWFDRTTCMTDFPDRILLFLAMPGEQSAIAFYELIMGALDLGAVAEFSDLGHGVQVRVMDIHLALADLARFEMMRRLGWLASYPGQRTPLLEIVVDHPRFREIARNGPPLLAESHPGYQEYAAQVDRDKEAFVRRLLSEALKAFAERTGE